jgi:hypothetical protein
MSPHPIYGKFLSCKAEVPDVVLETASPQTIPSGCARYSVSSNGEGTGSFSVGKGALIGKSRSGVDFIFDIEAGSQDSFFTVISAACSLIGQRGALRVLVCLEQPLERGLAERCGLYLIGSSAGMPGIVVDTDMRPPGLRLKETLRSSLPHVASAAYTLKSLLMPPRFFFTGMLEGRKLDGVFIGPPAVAGFYADAFLDQGRATDHPAIHPGITIKHAKRPEPGSHLLIPAYVRSLLKLPSSMERHFSGFGWNVRSDINKARHFTAKISHDIVDFIIYYHSMYVPTMRSRHQKHSVILSLEDLYPFFQKGFMLLIMRDGALQAGAMCVSCSRDRLQLKTLGMLEGDASLIKAGAGAAIYHLSILHAFENGYRILDLGVNPPFREDGVLLYKNKWGARCFIDEDCEWLSVWFSDEKTKERFLRSRKPFLAGSLPPFSQSRLPLEADEAKPEEKENEAG